MSDTLLLFEARSPAKLAAAAHASQGPFWARVSAMPKSVTVSREYVTL
jgi:hypothetical protein